MKIPTEHGFGVYAVLSVICLIIPTPLFWVGYMCITGGEYWPLILFGGIIFGSWFAAYGFFCKAREIRRTKKPEDEL
jgi:hypothetical protein